ncbi:28395_t:CDS:2 [Dentiscutata erythropus]|uniref:28395_t:CDS:1 n=1 Tax=Dentiscutata erythropus TaxID=1348616 RepID=A0A9N9CZR7_9GLOM|nr:28395_t:CDS:2 [Dentiscutata erythropus]
MKLGYYPKDARRTKRSGHQIPNNYQVQQLALDIHSCSKKMLEEHGFSDTNLDYIGLSILDEQVKIDFTESTLAMHVDSIIYACDTSLISRNSYRNLAAIMPFLE